MRGVYGDDCLDRSNVSRWCAFFQEGHVNLSDSPRSGRPTLFWLAILVKKFHHIHLPSALGGRSCETGQSQPPMKSKKKVTHQFLPLKAISDQ
ncbi:hypothetical protein J437_LFUL008117 [Ladona fulva]|uniref:Mos1 transposase HTH domain-containing protein n=1 Tax=Ladona fulva TaxID=123851 RepID=A0A8K0KEI7_LADFU|nr:hypothetical protein J437_LFUL008117 [Ladona fulva]